MKWYVSTRMRLGLTLGGASLVSVGLFAVAALRSGSMELVYLVWNLFLAWIPLFVVLWLERTLRRKLWSSWQALFITAVFVAFLPNSFYLITDVIHVPGVVYTDLMFDVVVFMSFILNGVLLGLVSTYIFHTELHRRLSAAKSWVLLSVLLFSASFAIYVGRDLRWNTWDILFNPASILFEVSDRLLAPFSHPEVFSTTFGFFVLIGTLHVIVWQFVRAARVQRPLN